MFKITFDEQEYTIRFRHFVKDQPEVPSYPWIPGNEYKRHVATMCEIFNRGKMFALGYAYLHPNDMKKRIFDRRVGRKLALADALKNASRHEHFKKPNRRMIWERYFDCMRG